jgi:glycosyltransferase involved in cell wall biosynthesis
MSANGSSPFLSVMIPTWNPDPVYLERTIRSVLDQLTIGDEVEIALVDDCSTRFVPQAFLDELGFDGVAVHRNVVHRGLAGTWNACVAEARGRWVHLLHQDDFVLPGFYRAIRHGIEREPTVAAAFCTSRFVDADGVGWMPTHNRDVGPGVLADWQRHVFEQLSIQCSAMVVRRDVYATLGGFSSEFRYALDWDMWKRIAVRYPIWYHPEPLACYRMPSASETARQRADGTHLEEIFRSIDHSAALLPPGVADEVTRRARSHYAVFAAESALTVLRSGGSWSDATRQLRIGRDATSTVGMLAATVRATARSALRLLTRWQRVPASTS